jgi:NAD(P)H-hydrate epimerase
MLKTSTEEVLSNRIQALRRLSKMYGNCFVVLKGHQTIVGNYDGNIYFNSSGNPHLAQGGAGDVLAGYLGGFIAQPLLQTDIERTIRYAVWRHGLAADYMQNDSKLWTIEELSVMLGCKINEKEIVFKI